MPSKSRKKIKGQARKANKTKRAAANPEQRSGNLRGRLETTHPFHIICTHGTQSNSTAPFSMICCHGGQTFGNITPDACSRFLYHYVKSFDHKTKRPFYEAMDALESAYKKYPEVLINDMHREIVKKSMISNAASYFLEVYDDMCSDFCGYSFSIPFGFAAALMHIDSYDPSSPVFRGRLDERDSKTWLRNLDISNSCKRSLVKYFVNQTPWSCLDGLYAKIKSAMPKMGACMNCKQLKERSSLFICTGCERVTYCSEACQLENVPKHKKHCKMWQSGWYTYDL